MKRLTVKPKGRPPLEQAARQVRESLDSYGTVQCNGFSEYEQGKPNEDRVWLDFTPDTVWENASASSLSAISTTSIEITQSAEPGQIVISLDIELTAIRQLYRIAGFAFSLVLGTLWTVTTFPDIKLVLFGLVCAAVPALLVWFDYKSATRSFEREILESLR